MAGNDGSGTVHSATDGGVAGSHTVVADAGVLVGPSTASEQNLVTAGLIPVACWRVDDVRFDFDSSFVLPAAAEEITALAKLRDAHKKPVVPRTDPKLPQFIFPPLSIFGHADPVGQDDYNKSLSGRRAAAIYGMLTRRDEVWEDLYSNKGVFTGPAAGDKWGTRVIQIMLTALGFPPDNNGQGGPDTTSAVRSFQSSQGLTADGKPGPQTRKKLFLAYMDKLCGTDFKLDKDDDFLARGKDTAGKGDFQGCGEFNPTLIFSEQQNKDFEQDKDKTERDAANAPNRRVMVLLFRPGSKVLAAKWPCPKAKEGVAGCKKRFWSDGENRRQRRLPDDLRTFGKSQDTFACRFYQRMTTSSICEKMRGRASWITEIPEGLEEAVFLVIRDISGKEILRLEPDLATPGPEKYRTFDLSQLDADASCVLELHAGDRFIAPIVSLAINPLRVNLDSANSTGAGASLFVAEPLAGPSSPFDDSGAVDLTGEVSCPLFPPVEEQIV
jgi:hypothetical protein